jgi:hypothetical protein
VADDPYAEFTDPYAEFKAAPKAAPPDSAIAHSPLAHFAAVGENALSAVTGGAGSLADAVTGSDPGTHDWAYQPRTPEGKMLQQGVAKVVTPIAQAANDTVAGTVGDIVGGFGGNAQAAADTAHERVPEAVNAVGTVAGIGGAASEIGGALRSPKVLPDAVKNAAQAAVDKTAASGNAGAAGAAIDVSTLTPETQAELAKIGARGNTPNPAALARHVDAETLPVPVRLTQGQASGDAATISDEFNRKGQDNNAIGDRYNQQDQALQDNLQTIHREAAPTTVGNDDIQNGQAVIDSLKRYDQPKVAAINSAYKAAKDANGGDLQMDGSGFTDAAEAALKPQGKGRFLPGSVQGVIDDVKAADGKMSLDDFEGYRTQLANEVRKAQQSGDGNAVAAINKVRDALEATPPADGTSAAAKGLYDNARSLAKSRFDEMKADPAYDAAVADPTPVGRLSPDADKFAGKYILNGAKADLQQLRPKLDQEGGEAMTSASMNYLQKQAGLDKGKFLQSGYNSALKKIEPKADELIGSRDTQEQLKQLGRVANTTQALSRGSFANTSHTFVAAAKEHAANTAEGLANVAAHGVPVGTWARKFLAGRSTRAAIHESLKPGAGLED